MDKRTVVKIVKDYKKVVLGLIPNATIYLYGSYSKGTAHKDSDIDVAVVVPKYDGDWWAASASLWGATRKVNTLIEPVLMEDCHPSPLYEDVMRTGMAI